MLAGGAAKIDEEPEALIAPVLGLSPMRIGAVADEHLKWWRQARFGMFIHFGVYAIPARGRRDSLRAGSSRANVPRSA